MTYALDGDSLAQGEKVNTMPELMTKTHLHIALRATELRLVLRFALVLGAGFGLLLIALRLFSA